MVKVYRCTKHCMLSLFICTFNHLRFWLYVPGQIKERNSLCSASKSACHFFQWANPWSKHEMVGGIFCCLVFFVPEYFFSEHLIKQYESSVYSYCMQSLYNTIPKCNHLCLINEIAVRFTVWGGKQTVLNLLRERTLMYLNGQFWGIFKVILSELDFFAICSF